MKTFVLAQVLSFKMCNYYCGLKVKIKVLLSCRVLSRSESNAKTFPNEINQANTVWRYDVMKRGGMIADRRRGSDGILKY